MTPSDAPVTGLTAKSLGTAPAVLSCLITITKRPDFLRAARAKRQSVKGFVLQARKRSADESNPDSIRIGFTCSKKVGNAVARNRAKRRLREIARDILPLHGLSGWDYVLIGRSGITSNRPYIEMQGDLVRALSIIHGKKQHRKS